jgi:hypothetical protein
MRGPIATISLQEEGVYTSRSLGTLSLFFLLSIGMPCCLAIDPQDVSPLLFATPPVQVEPYVGPIAVTCQPRITQGRGVLATRSITAGELLWVTPPTVSVNVEAVHTAWQARAAASTERKLLEECTEQILLDAMHEACGADPAAAASFLCLVGSPTCSSDSLPSLDVLLGQASGGEVDATAISRDDLRSIIRANAFGPDGMHSYEHVEEEWRAGGLSSTTDTATLITPTYQPPRLLGLYPLAAMLNHSCQANAVRVYAAGDVMVVHSLQNIAEGEEICWSYIPPTRPCPLRQDLLQSQHGFCCTCHRCQAEEEALTSVEALASLQGMADLNQGRLVTPLAHLHGRLHRAVRLLEEDILPTAGLSNQVHRYLRISYLYIYIHYFNSALADLSEDPLVPNVLRSDLLTLATQLHFSFCACHNASTEHLSVSPLACSCTCVGGNYRCLHVSYELVLVSRQIVPPFCGSLDSAPLLRTRRPLARGRPGSQ